MTRVGARRPAPRARGRRELPGGSPVFDRVSDLEH